MQTFVSLKPRSERDVSADQVVARLRGKLSRESGARLFLVPGQDIRIGARTSSSQYEYSVKADDLQDLREWEPKIRRAMMRLSELEDINTDYEDRGLQTSLVVDRDAAARLGRTIRDIATPVQNPYGPRPGGGSYNPIKTSLGP